MQQTADDAAHEQHGIEHGDQRDGHRDAIVKPISRELLDRRLHRRFAAFDVADDVLEHDDRVIDDEADGEGERQQREVVETETALFVMSA